MKFSGIDGCKSGWIVCEINKTEFQFYLLQKIDEILPKINEYKAILIDIPLGFADKEYRKCDILARKMLKNRRGSIFLLPCEEALKANEYNVACRINEKIMGKKFSKQVWNIRKKILEVNDFVRKYWLQGKIRESHPEICLMALNNNLPCKYSKRKKEGIEERIKILSKYLSLDKAKIFYEYNKRLLNFDDLLDAIALAINARNYKNFKKIPPDSDIDKYGIEREIVFSIDSLHLL